MSEITNTQLLFLDNLIYLNLFNQSGKKLNEAIEYIINNIDDYVNDKNLPASMTKSQWVELLKSFLNNKENEAFLNDYTI